MTPIDRTAVRHALRLAWIDLVRTVRKQTDWRGSSSSVLGTVVYVVVLVAGSAGGAYLGYRAGRSLVGGGLAASDAPIETVRGLFAVLWLLLTVVFAVRAVGQRGTLSEPAGVLTVVPTREAFAGVLLAEYAFVLCWLLLPAVALGAGLAAGSGTLAPVLAVPLAVAAASATCVAVGIPVGLGVRHGATRFPFAVQHKTGIVVAAFLAYFVALSSGAWNRVVVELFEPMARSPVGWYADLAMVGLPALGAAPTRAGAAIALSLAISPVALAAGTALADRHWFSDPALAGEAESDGGVAPGSTAADRASDTANVPAERRRGRGVETRLEPLVGRATASLIATTWRRSLRSPMNLLYAFYPLLFGAGFIAEIVRTGEVPSVLAYLVLLFAAWAAGVIFTLNPLGDRGAVLSTTLLSGVTGREFVRAHLLAGLLVAIPIGTLATAVVGLLSPLEARRLVLLVAATPVVTTVAAAASVGIGMAFPRFEATNVTRSIETVIPSRWAFVLFTLYLFATAAAGTVVLEPTAAALGAAILTLLLPFGLAVTERELLWTARIALVVLLPAPIPAYRFAVKRFDRYTLR